MPNMLDDGFLDQAGFVHTVALLPTNSDFNLQGTISNVVTTASLTGAFTITVETAPYATALTQIMIQRLVNMGYTATLSGTVLTINW